MRYITLCQEWLHAFVTLFFPRCCVVCEQPLSRGEDFFCTLCNIHLPRTNYHLQADNPTEQIFWGKILIERATSFVFYRKGSDFRQLLYGLKYKGKSQLGVVMGRHMATELLATDFFRGMEVIVSVPLHPKKQRLRGYNQSERIAKGISDVTGIPLITNAVIRCKHTETQTHKSTIERWENVADVFEVRNPQALSGKHILLIDDVLTTGATTVACVAAMAKIKKTSFSILTLAKAE